VRHVNREKERSEMETRGLRVGDFCCQNRTRSSGQDRYANLCPTPNKNYNSPLFLVHTYSYHRPVYAPPTSQSSFVPIVHQAKDASNACNNKNQATMMMMMIMKMMMMTHQLYSRTTINSFN